MSNIGFLIDKDTHAELISTIAEMERKLYLNPALIYWTRFSREELPKEWGDAEIAIWEATKEKLDQQWLQFKKMKEEGNAPQSSAEMCAFLFGKEDDDGNE